ncbi:MAG TPA: hypothetical protein VL737_01675 [Candidatus Pristimantibacillus sp.]|nr:hypothetical protein [Candidatus Pristimantibacillus sp.]
MSRTTRESGQTVIALLIFMMLVISITAVAATVTVINVRNNNAVAGGEQAMNNAETGAENALVRLQRDPSYSGETITLPNGAATISVSGTTTKTVVSEGTYGNFRRTVTVTATLTTNVLAETSWSETP